MCPLPVQAIKEAFKQHRVVKEHITIRDVALEAAAKAIEAQQSAPAPEPEFVPGVHSGGASIPTYPKEQITTRDVAFEAAFKAKAKAETQQSSPAAEPLNVPGVHLGGAAREHDAALGGLP